MDFSSLTAIVADEPFFETGLLLTGEARPNDIRRQLSRWNAAGKVQQLKRGLYTLAPPFRKVVPHPFEIANALQRGSYVSLNSALEYHGLIPERVARVTSVGAARPRTWETPLGIYELRHIKADWVRGFERRAVADGRWAYVALPEKALLDWVYLEPGGDHLESLDALRLQQLDKLDLERLHRLARQSGRPKLRRAAEGIEHLAREESEEYEDL